jgi:hypothetical protein
VSWKYFLRIVQAYTEIGERRIITMPDWLFIMSLKHLKKLLRTPNAEMGLTLPDFAVVQMAETFIDPSLGCIPLGVEDDELEEAIAESITLAVDILDGKVLNYLTMKGE